MRVTGTPEVSQPRVVVNHVLFVLLAIDVLLIVLFLLRPALRIVFPGELDILSVDRESSLPSFYSVVQWTIAAVLLLVTAAIQRARGDRWWRYWLASAVLGFILAADESLQFHERFGDPVRESLQFDDGFPGWIIPAGIAVIVVLVAMARFAFVLPRSTRWIFAAATVAFLVGSVVLELYGPYLSAIVTNLGSGCEELFEMVGVTLLIYGTLRYLRDYASEDGITAIRLV